MRLCVCFIFTLTDKVMSRSESHSTTAAIHEQAEERVLLKKSFHDKILKRNVVVAVRVLHPT